jgi:hypothetical protein
VDVGELFVRVRPDPSGFKQEASGPIAAAGRDLGKVFLAAFAVGGIATTIKGLVEAATSHQAAFAVLDQTIKDAGAANTLYGKSIESLLEKEARLKGFSDEDLASAFQRLISVTHDTGKAYKDLGLAEDLARFRHIDLATAALALSKVEQGSFTALQRYGIVVPKVTTAVDELTRRRAEAVAAGAKFTATDKLLYDSALKAAQATDKQATSVAGLALVQQRTAGAASTFADTASGQFARLQQDFHQFEVAIGEPLLSGLAGAAEGLGTFITKATASGQAAREVKTAAHDVGVAFRDVKDVVEVIGPPLLRVADAFGGVTHSAELLVVALGVNKLLGAFTALPAAEAAAGAGAVAAGGEMAAAGTLASAAALKVNALRLGLLRVAAIGEIAVVVDVIEHIIRGQTSVDNTEKKQGINDPVMGLLGHIPGVNALINAAQAVGDALVPPVNRAGETVGEQTGKAWDAGLRAGLERIARESSGKAFLSAPIIQAAEDALQSVKTGEANNRITAAAEAMLKSLRDGIANDQTDIAGINQSLADAVAQGVVAVDNAVQQAKQNLNTIGQSLAASITQVLEKPITDAQTRLTERSNRLGAETARRTLTQLGESVILPNGRNLSRDPEQAVRQLERLAATAGKFGKPAIEAFLTQYETAASGLASARLAVQQDRVNVTTAGAQRRIADLTDAFNTHRIDRKQLQQGILRELVRDGVSYKKAGAELGSAFLDGFQSQVLGLGQQALASARGPQRLGGGLVPSIVNPLDTVNATNKQIAQLQQQRDQKQLDESKKQTELLKKIAGERARKAFTSSLEHNPGGASARSKALTGVSGG